MPKWSVKAVCAPCGGTGLYVGMGERDGFAVVCNRCKGTGCATIAVDYEPFEKRKPPPREVTHVLQCNPGIMATPCVMSAGVKLNEWVDDPTSPAKRGREMRAHTCPAWWYQSADYKKKPEWEECQTLGPFSNCDLFSQKDRCWDKFDREEEEP